MNEEHQMLAREPDQFSEEKLQTFIALVIEGDEVGGQVLNGNVRNAKVLVFLEIANQVKGTAALKRPKSSYRRGIVRKAKTEIPVEKYPYELGYIFIAEEARGNRCSGKLVSKALNSVPGVGIFSTVRVNNKPMRKTLLNYGFTKEGAPYGGQNSKIQLFVRPALVAGPIQV